MRFENVATGLQLMFEFEEIVDLTIEDNSDGAVFTGDGLLSSRDVDNRKPAHPQRDAILYQNALIIGAAMSNYPAHAIEDLFALAHLASFANVPEINESCNTAHAV